MLFRSGDLVPEYQGMDLLEAREKIVEKLRQIGALVKEEEYTHNVAKCERCKNTIEPKISEQWFVKMQDLAKRASDSVRNGKTRFVPQRYEKQYFHWLDNIRDWCISRQLWWGHRIPAFYCEDCRQINVSKSKPKTCEKCGSEILKQDEDTLDTWFSSALWPFSTLGWPNKQAEDYQRYYPTNVLVTGFDIITFWVSRMMTQGLEFTDVEPFKDVLIHGIIRDSKGRKMSKTLGNGIDPLDVIEKYGADSLRFSVISGITMGNDIRFSPEKLEQASNFANKIWNAAKFITMNLPSIEQIKEFDEKAFDTKTMKHQGTFLKIEDQWIICKIEELILEVTKNMENYDLGVALDKIYNFIWNEFCDWYIEMAKTRIYSENTEERVQVYDVLIHVFAKALKLLHPFMPFLTSEIYNVLSGYIDDTELMVSKWPEVEVLEFEKERDVVEKLKQAIVEIRNIRSKMNVPPNKKSTLIFIAPGIEETIKQSEEFLGKLGFASQIIVQNDETGIPENAIAILVEDLKIFIPFEDLVNLEEEIARLKEEKKKLEAEVLRGEKMLSNEGFVSKAPSTKIEEEKTKLQNYKSSLKVVEERLVKLEKGVGK